ncbi:MAG TPA: T9SS type A sorting domain-containing protein [Bacteroidia bacterium]|nr:T9SS type A sorting domain-containing protein [Bacteroidia bacterium]HNU33699.1 T9SS type A sorting domain-containing protein [Bacteroidia bacterium]
MLSTIERKILLILFLLCITITFAVKAAVKTTVGSGAWNAATTWSPAGVPVTTDEVFIAAGHTILINADVTVKSVTVQQGAFLNWSTQKKLTLNGSFIVHGKADLTGGNIYQQLPQAIFEIGASGTMIWNPADNTIAGATLFTQSSENFLPTSSLVIKKWYSYSTVPLGQVVTGNFGNVTITTQVGNTLFAWNQRNQFESHKIIGTLTIDNGWVILDTAGVITNTTIGNIVMSNMNSFLDFHVGNHPSSFKVITGNITNTGGAINGIYNGNGNITLNVTGNFTNLGNVELIYNTGVQNIGNGNAALNVTGNYLQSAGDLRGVFNLSSTTAGSASLNFGTLTHTGGVIMAFYACNQSALTNRIKVNGHATINLNNAQDKFRVNGLTTLWGNYSKSKSDFTVEGNLTLSGIATAEFTSSGSVGTEVNVISGDLNINGITTNFNYGSHAATMQVGGKINVTSGTVCLSKMPGDLTATVTGDVIISGGTLAVKGAIGKADVTFKKNFIQSGGTFFLHNNVSSSTADIINLVIEGIFTQLNGIFNFDDNPTSAAHVLTVKGTQFNVAGNGKITKAGNGSSTVFGIIQYAAQGVMNYARTGASQVIEQVKQIILSGCVVDVTAGNFQLASHTSVNELLTIKSNGSLNMRTSQIVSNAQFAQTGFKVDAQGKIITANTNGFYNSQNTATVSSGNGMTFNLDEWSWVEYNGTSNQVVTTSANINQKYGVLRINFQGVADINYAQLNSDISVRKQLILEKGELNLNGHNLIVEYNAATAITKNNGYIKAEKNSSLVKIKNAQAGTVYVIPFAYSSNKQIPIQTKIISGNADVSFNTWHTTPDNKPFPSGITSLTYNGNNVANTDVVDRWYYISGTGIKADVMLTYLGIENTLEPAKQNSQLMILTWDGGVYKSIQANGTGAVSNTATVEVKNVSLGNYWTIAAKQNTTLQSAFNVFDATLQNKEVLLDWSFNNEQAGDVYTIERSEDGLTFSELDDVDGTGSSAYDYNDTNPLEGISYYRVKQKAVSGSYTYSEIRQISNQLHATASLEIINVAPNPFISTFTVEYNVGVKGEMQMSLISSNGQEVFREKVQAETGHNTWRFNQKNPLPVGTYVLVITGNKSRVSKKLYKS